MPTARHLTSILVLSTACATDASPDELEEILPDGDGLQGVISSDLETHPARIAAAIIWMAGRNAGDGLADATLVDVPGNFPYRFHLDVSVPAPERALERHSSGFRTAEGRVVAVDRDKIVTHDDGSVDIRAALIGSSDQVTTKFVTTQYRLFYAETAPPPGDFWEYITPTQGYHLIEEHGGRIFRWCTEAGIDQCIGIWAGYDWRERDPTVAERATFEAICRGVHQLSSGFDPIPLNTPLRIALQPRALYITPEATGGFYPQNRLPGCD